jgi:hypothetical protein
VLFGTSLSEYALLNTSRMAANDFWAKECSRMNTRSAREPAQLLRNWREQRPRNKDDLDSSVTGRFGESITRRWTCFWFNFSILVRDCFWVAI